MLGRIFRRVTYLSVEIETDEPIKFAPMHRQGYPVMVMSRMVGGDNPSMDVPRIMLHAYRLSFRWRMSQPRVFAATSGFLLWLDK